MKRNRKRAKNAPSAACTTAGKGVHLEFARKSPNKVKMQAGFRFSPVVGLERKHSSKNGPQNGKMTVKEHVPAYLQNTLELMRQSTLKGPIPAKSPLKEQEGATPVKEHVPAYLQNTSDLMRQSTLKRPTTVKASLKEQEPAHVSGRAPQLPGKAEAKSQFGAPKKMANKSIHKPIPKLASKTTSFIIENFGSLKSVQVKPLAESKAGNVCANATSNSHSKQNAVAWKQKGVIPGNPARPVKPPLVSNNAPRDPSDTGPAFSLAMHSPQQNGKVQDKNQTANSFEWTNGTVKEYEKCGASKVPYLASNLQATALQSPTKCAVCKEEFPNQQLLRLHRTEAHENDMIHGMVAKTKSGKSWKVSYQDAKGNFMCKMISIEKFGEALGHKIARVFLQQGPDAADQMMEDLKCGSNFQMQGRRGNGSTAAGKVELRENQYRVQYQEEGTGLLRHRYFSLKHYGKENAKELARRFMLHGEEGLVEAKQFAALNAKEKALKQWLKWKSRTKCYEANVVLDGQKFTKIWCVSQELTREAALCQAEKYLQNMNALNSSTKRPRKKRPRPDSTLSPQSTFSITEGREDRGLAKLLEDISDDDRESLSEDVFDPDYEKPLSEERKCAFCHGNEEKGRIMLKGLKCEREEVWLDRHRPLVVGKAQRRLWVHRFCALFSPRAIILNNKWYNVTKEIQRGRRIKCSRCKRPGGTLGCSKNRCSVSCHFHCARMDGWMPSTMAVHINPFVCQEHMLKEREEEIKSWETQLEDISGGREAIPVTWINELDQTEYPSDFIYTTRLVDSDSFSLNHHLHELRCCDCQDNCVHPEKCACLQKMHGKVYNSLGCLMPNPPTFVYECNKRCFCSTSCCSNQVVANGLRFRLQVFRKLDDRSSNHSLDGWGVRSLDPIPQGGFVCEFVGQIICGDAKFPELCAMNSWTKMNKAESNAAVGDSSCKRKKKGHELYVDNSTYSNVSRFLKLGASKLESNLFRQAVFVEKQDSRVPRLAFFAKSYIPELTELLIEPSCA